MDMPAAIEAIVADDRTGLASLLDAQPGLVRLTVTDERFIEAIVHQFYAGDTLLHVAAAGFRAELASLLIARGADLAARNRRGATPLHYAADANHYAPEAQAATVVVLLKAGAIVDAPDKSGVTALHRAVRTRAVTAVEALLAGGADTNLPNGSGSTPLFLAGRTTGRGGTGTPEARAAQGEIIGMLRAAGAVD